MFLFKKLVAPLLFPVPLCLILLLAGLALLWLTRRQKAGKVLVTAAAALFALLSYGAVSDRLVGTLERRYPPLTSERLAGAPVKWVVVLGGGTSSDAELPLTGRLSEASLARLVEGLRLHRQIPGSRLILSGGSVFGYGADADAMRALAVQLGVDESALVVDAVSLDTESQARNLREVVRDDGFILVTSAAHMARAVALFERAGMKPLPAPTHYLAHRNVSVSPADFYPGAGGLRRAEHLFYEYLGLAWAKLRGRA